MVGADVDPAPRGHGPRPTARRSTVGASSVPARAGGVPGGDVPGGALRRSGACLSDGLVAPTGPRRVIALCPRPRPRPAGRRQTPPAGPAGPAGPGRLHRPRRVRRCGVGTNDVSRRVRGRPANHGGLHRAARPPSGGRPSRLAVALGSPGVVVDPDLAGRRLRRGLPATPPPHRWPLSCGLSETEPGVTCAGPAVSAVERRAGPGTAALIRRSARGRGRWSRRTARRPTPKVDAGRAAEPGQDVPNQSAVRRPAASSSVHRRRGGT